MLIAARIRRAAQLAEYTRRGIAADGQLARIA